VLSLGAAIFAFLAAGTYKSIEEAQDKMCPPHKIYDPDPSEQPIYEELYGLYRNLYFAFGTPDNNSLGGVLPALIRTAKSANKGHDTS
jgi:L-ribulokinase